MNGSKPTPIMPVPAARFSGLRGQRIIVGVPGVGFRGDLRADDPVMNGGRTFIPVLAEQDYYRAESEQVEVFAPLVPVDRVWVEWPDDGTNPSIHSLGALDQPQRMDPTLALQARSVLGRRVVQAVPDGFVRHLRAVTDVFAGDGDILKIRICAESEWYLWATTGSTPSTAEVAADTVWVE